MAMNKTFIAFAGLVVLAAGCYGNKTKETVEEERIPVVNITETERHPVPQDAVYSATIQANIINNIAPQTVSRIQKINVTVGDFVNAGKILAEMDRVQLQQAELQMRNSELELGRVKQLLSEGGISQSDYDALELSYNVTKNSYENLLENTILRSPIQGVVSARNYDPGDMYSMGQPIFVVQQITPVKLLVGISETDYTKVNVGDKVLVTADALPGEEFEGSISRIYPVMDAASHTFNVEVRIANAQRKLRPGMFARVTVNFGDNNSIVVPDGAVVKMQGSGVRSVYVLDSDNVVELRTVTLGRHFDGKYEILSGLEENEKIVVKGQAALKSGIKVEVQ